MDSRLQILHVTATTTGGVGLLILQLVKRLDPRDFALSVAFGRGYLLDRSFDESGVPVYTLSTSRRAGLLSVVKGIVEVYRLLRRGRYHLVQSHTSVGGLVARVACWAARVPVVWTVHGLGAHPGHAPWKRALLRVVEAMLDRVTDHYVAVSEDLRDEGVRRGIYRPERVTVIPNGLEITSPPSDTEGRALRRELGLAEGCPVIGTVTRLEPQKAIDVFLHAAARVKVRAPEVAVLIAGDGPQRAELEALARHLGLGSAVRFLGWRSDALRVLAALDLFCMSSRWEGCPMVLLEAMAAQRPVVATDIGGVREIVVQGETGLLVPAGDAAAFAEASLRLLASPAERQRMGEAGRLRMQSRFSLEKMVTAYASLYRGLAAASGA